MGSSAIAPVTYANPYWETVRSEVVPSDEPWRSGPVVGSMSDFQMWGGRREIISKFCFTITDPITVAFVAEHAGPRVIDPLAGTGYWAWLLGQLGTDVVASDLHPPDSAENAYHKAGVVHVPVLQADAVDAVTVHGQGRTLLLSWPPYEDPIGEHIVRTYPGDRVVYIGENEGGCCGSDAMWRAIDEDWDLTTEHHPVRWWGLNDYVAAYTRRSSISTGGIG